MCFALTDCDDNNPLVHPGGGESCKGDGLDYKCNGVTNKVGGGDCACTSGQTGLSCAPVGYVYPAGKKPGDPLSPTDWEAHDVPVSGSLQVRMELVGGRPTIASWGTALTVNRCQVSSPSAVTNWASIPISSTPGVFATTAIGNQVAVAWLSANSEVRFAMSAPVDCW